MKRNQFALISQDSLCADSYQNLYINYLDYRVKQVRNLYFFLNRSILEPVVLIFEFRLCRLSFP